MTTSIEIPDSSGGNILQRIGPRAGRTGSRKRRETGGGPREGNGERSPRRLFCFSVKGSQAHSRFCFFPAEGRRWWGVVVPLRSSSSSLLALRRRVYFTLSCEREASNMALSFSDLKQTSSRSVASLFIDASMSD